MLSEKPVEVQTYCRIRRSADIISYSALPLSLYLNFYVFPTRHHIFSNYVGLYIFIRASI